MNKMRQAALIVKGISLSLEQIEQRRGIPKPVDNKSRHLLIERVLRGAFLVFHSQERCKLETFLEELERIEQAPRPEAEKCL